MQSNDVKYCKCKHPSSTYTVSLDWGEQDMCSDCHKPLEDGYRDSNHYDGEDHVVNDEY